MDIKDLNPLITDLSSGACVMVLGPEAFLLNNEMANSPGHRELIIASSERLQEQPYSKEDGFFYPMPDGKEGDWYYEKNEITDEIKTFYTGLASPEFYKQLALLPFNLIISLSPDDLLPKVMDNISRPHKFVFYKPGTGLYEQIKNDGQVSDFVPLTDAKKIFATGVPLVFNFMGHYLHADSLVFTYDDMFEFMYSLSPVQNNFNPELMNAIQKARSFLFIGFGYDKWYLKIFLFLFKKILGDNDKINRKAIFNYDENNNDTVKLFSSQFKMKFFNESSVDFIVKTLYQKCAELNLLQKVTPKIPQYKILYFSSLPAGYKKLRFDKEYRAIDDSYKQFYIDNPDRKDSYKIFPHQECTTQIEFLNTISRETPHMVILALHGSADNKLLFQGANDQAQPLNIDELIKDILLAKRKQGSNLQTILFSCCNSEEIAKKVVEFLPNAIGMVGTIADDALPVFCEGFFRSFYTDQDTKLAADMGIRAVEKVDNLKDNAAKIILYSQQEAIAETAAAKARV